MSDSIFVAIVTKHLPKLSEIEALLAKEGFAVKLQRDWEPLVDMGFVPIHLYGEEVGCEVFPINEDNQPGENDFSLERLRKAGHSDCDQAFEIAFRSEDELKAAALLSFALATVGHGVVSDDEFEGPVLYRGDELRDWLEAKMNGNDGTAAPASVDSDIAEGVLAGTGHLFLALHLLKLKDTAVKAVHHEPLWPDIANASAKDIGDARYASDLRIEFANGVSIGGQSWFMRNDTCVKRTAIMGRRNGCEIAQL